MGVSGHAKVVADIIKLMGTYNLLGFLDNVNPHRKGESFCGSTILGGIEYLDVLENTETLLIFGFGNNSLRLQLAADMKQHGFQLATAIHPRAIISSSAFIGAGTIIAAGAVINPATTIGESVIVNTAASVDHDCQLEDGVHISPGAHLGGHVIVERGAWVGIGVAVKDRVRIGAGSIIGAGAVVVKDIPPNVIAYGVPAHVVRDITT